MEAPVLDEEQLNHIYKWVDEQPLSRPKRSITRDFADGVLVAEIVSNYFPQIVEVHNYSQANSIKEKLYNWNTLNTKVFTKMDFVISKKDINNVINAVPDAIERVLKVIEVKMRMYQEKIERIKQEKALLSNDNSQVQAKKSPQKKQKQSNEKEIQSILKTIEDVKIKKMEQLIKLKDDKIYAMSTKIKKLTKNQN